MTLVTVKWSVLIIDEFGKNVLLFGICVMSLRRNCGKADQRAMAIMEREDV